jgi:predicted DNA repair protein MutK
MAGGSLLLLLDDIASILDDVSVLTKVAAAKTSGVLGDDLALNAQQVAGVASKRELPVVLAVAKGSAVNKVILVPAALAISATLPWAVTPLLMIGGLYLCFEGAEKLVHKFLVKTPHHEPAMAAEKVLSESYEKDKIKGAIRTDFILSAEIIAITLGTVAGAVFLTQFLVLSAIAVVMTVGVYGLVALIVKLDDLGVYLATVKGPASPVLGALGRFIVSAAPWLMKALSILGTAAMFLVGGGILTHGIPAVHHAIEHLAHGLHDIPVIGGPMEVAGPILMNGIFGVIAGAAAVVVWTLIKKFR